MEHTESYPPPGSRAVEMTEAEEELWDELWDTDAARCCSCPSCNFYAPGYEQHKDEPCILRTLIERIIATRLATLEEPADVSTHEPCKRCFNYGVRDGLNHPPCDDPFWPDLEGDA